MYGENVRPNPPTPSNPSAPTPLPTLGTLLVDTSRADRVGEFRGSPTPTGRCVRQGAARSGRSSPAMCGPPS